MHSLFYKKSLSKDMLLDFHISAISVMQLCLLYFRKSNFYILVLPKIYLVEK